MSTGATARKLALSAVNLHAKATVVYVIDPVAVHLKYVDKTWSH